MKIAEKKQIEVDGARFRPHLTLGGWRPGRPADASLADRLSGYRGPDWPVSEVALSDGFTAGVAYWLDADGAVHSEAVK